MKNLMVNRAKQQPCCQRGNSYASITIDFFLLSLSELQNFEDIKKKKLTTRHQHESFYVTKAEFCLNML